MEKTVVVDHRDKHAFYAKVVAMDLKLSSDRILMSIDSFSLVDVTVIVGIDYKKFIPDSIFLE